MRRSRFSEEQIIGINPGPLAKVGPECSMLGKTDDPPTRPTPSTQYRHCALHPDHCDFRPLEPPVDLPELVFRVFRNARLEGDPAHAWIRNIMVEDLESLHRLANAHLAQGNMDTSAEGVNRSRSAKALQSGSDFALRPSTISKAIYASSGAQTK